MREFKPGDVATLSYNYADGGLAMRVEKCGTKGHSPGGHWHFANGGHGSGAVAREIRALVVIDAEDREQVERLLAYIAAAECGDGMSPRDALQAALREFADPKPPRPEEPQGLGAVVEDSKGVEWYRWSVRPKDRGQAWISVFDEDRCYPTAYADITAVRVLSPGVTGGDD